MRSSPPEPYTRSVIGLGEANLLSALSMGGRFGLVTIDPIFVPWHDRQIRLHELLAPVLVQAHGIRLDLHARHVAQRVDQLGGAAQLALLGAAASYGAGAVYARRNVKGLRPMVPAAFQVGFAFVIAGALALVFEQPFDLRPDAMAIGRRVITVAVLALPDVVPFDYVEFARTMRQFCLSASLLGGLSSVLGFWIAYEYDLPVGPTDIALLGMIYAAVAALRKVVEVIRIK
mgnify:CR=1 FL=1